MDYEKKYKEALERARIWKDKSGMPKNKQGILDEIFPELAESEDERMIREIKRYIKEQGDKPSGLPNGTAAVDDMLSWFEKQGKSSDQIHYWTEEEIEPIISDYLRGAEHYGGMIGRLRCLKPKSLERQGESLNMDIDIESMTEAYKQRLINQCNGVRNSPLVNMCITSFRHGIENTLDAMKLKGLKKQKIIDVQSLRIGLLRDIAMSLVIFLDENTLGMDMSSMECEDIESAVINSDWLKIYAYMKKKLEKQGEKPQGKSALEAIKEEVDNQNCVKPADKVEPKFHGGEWIVWNDKFYKVNYNGCGYELIGQDGLRTSLEYGAVDKDAHIFGVADAKDGDVLISQYGKPFIYNGNHDSFHIGSYCGISVESRFKVATEKCLWTENVNIQPATKEQRDLLFKKMHEAGYEWDNEKKELKKIEDEPLVIDEGKSEMDYCFTKMMNGEKINPAWSEEDDRNANGIIDEIEANRSDAPSYDIPVYEGYLNWLKSIKQRIGG